MPWSITLKEVEFMIEHEKPPLSPLAQLAEDAFTTACLLFAAGMIAMWIGWNAPNPVAFGLGILLFYVAFRRLLRALNLQKMSDQAALLQQFSNMPEEDRPQEYKSDTP